MNSPVSLWHGKDLLQIAACQDGDGYIALRNGRCIGKAPTKAEVMRLVIRTAAWFRSQD